MKFWLVALLIGVSPCLADLAAWRLLHFQDDVADPTKELAVWGDEADPDNDQYSNLQEYAQGTDPNVFSEPIEWAFVDEYGDRHLSLTFPYQLTDPPLATVIESSSDAKHWAPASIFSALLEVPITSSTSLVNRVPQGSTERVTVRTNASLEDTSRLFLRTRVMPEEEALPSLLDAGEFLIEDGLLTDPLLQNPTSSTVTVVWYTSFAGSGHRLVLGDALDQIVPASTTKLSRMLEDDDSELPAGVAAELGAPTASGVRARDVWRHEAVASSLASGERIPYFVECVNDSSQRFRSEVYTLQPKPANGQRFRVLLTSDQQNRAMSAANYEKVEEVAGLLDAVFFAGDFVDHPNRASQWFDRANDERPAFFPAMQGRLRQLHPGGAFQGGVLLQHAPLLGILGNHEMSGRWFPEQNDIVTMYNDSQPSWYSEIRYQDYLAGGNPADPDYVRNHSHESLTYDEMWPSPSGTNLPYWSFEYGDVFVIGLHVNRIWRLWGTNRKGKEGEAPVSVNDPNAWGFGDHLFEGIGMGTAQYDWLVSELASSAFQNAKYKVVMVHQTVFGLGDNAYPVVAAQEATFEYDLGSGPETLEITFPLTESEWDAQIAPLLGSITSIDYAYETAEDMWKHQIEPLLVNAGVDLVFCGHSHLWNRSKVGAMHYLESSNVGNSFGARYDDGAGSKTWPSGAFPPGDPHGRPMIGPTHFNPMQAWEGFSNPLPFVSSNRLTVFSVLDSGDGTVRSYVFDTENPGVGVVLMDEFSLSGTP